jgi:Flp pilus assembly protein TadG
MLMSPIRNAGAVLVRSRGLLRTFARARSGVAAIEFALIAPVLIAILFGMTEVSVLVSTDRKLSLVSRALADLTSRVTSMTTGGIGDVFAAGKVILQPYATDTLKMRVSSITITTSGSTVTGAVDWSCANGTGMTSLPKGLGVPVPTSFRTEKSFILVETGLTYTPMFGETVTKTRYLSETLPWPVRNTAQVTWSGTPC